MGTFDLLSWLVGRGRSTDPEVTERHRRLTDRARSGRLTPERLALPGERTSEPLDAYLEDGEQPHFVLVGSRLLIVDAAGSSNRKHPTRLLVVLVTDDRLLFVVGGRLADDVFEVPLSDVTSISVDEDDPDRHVIVEADRDDEEMTFYAEVALADASDVEDAVGFVRSRT